jgi:hypothetical protein
MNPVRKSGRYIRANVKVASEAGNRWVRKQI